MGWVFSGVVGFDLRPLLQGQLRIAKVKKLKVLIADSVDRCSNYMCADMYGVV